MSLNQIRRVAIAGGTHGNELTGIYLIKKFENLPNLIQRSNFQTVTFIANPKAYEIGKRYLDTDLNRCFLKQDLANPSLSSYEAKRAQQISQIFGKGGSLEADFVIDLHSTTSNMGLTLILRSLQSHYIDFAAFLQAVKPEIKILCSLISDTENSHLDSISEFGCTLEVGAIAQNILDARLFQQTEELIYLILDYLETCNQRKQPKLENIPVIYQVTHSIDFPRNASDEIQAMVHPNLQFRDYQPLYPGKPIFLTFKGEEIIYKGESIVYPVFINEAAYYEKGIAMCITQKVEISQ
jgi:N-acyl-aromatic-L-amino acid amidohydrolase